MKCIKIIKEKFKYPLDMPEKIIAHEEKMLHIYSQVINEKYEFLFKKYGCTLKLGLSWRNTLTYVISHERMPFRCGYVCDLYCEVQKNGKMVEVISYDGEVDYYPLFAVTTISGVDFCFSHSPYSLISDMDDEFFEMMDEAVELIEEADRLGGHYG